MIIFSLSRTLGQKVSFLRFLKFLANSLYGFQMLVLSLLQNCKYSQLCIIFFYLPDFLHKIVIVSLARKFICIPLEYSHLCRYSLGLSQSPSCKVPQRRKLTSRRQQFVPTSPLSRILTPFLGVTDLITLTQTKL